MTGIFGEYYDKNGTFVPEPVHVANVVYIVDRVTSAEVSGVYHVIFQGGHKYWNADKIGDTLEVQTQYSNGKITYRRK